MNVLPFKFTECEYRVESDAGEKLFYSPKREKCEEVIANSKRDDLRVIPYPVVTLG